MSFQDVSCECQPVVMQLKLNRSQFTNWLCRQLTKSCKGKPPKLPADRKPGPPFTVLDEQQAQLQKMMAGMKVRQEKENHMPVAMN